MAFLITNLLSESILTSEKWSSEKLANMLEYLPFIAVFLPVCTISCQGGFKTGQPGSIKGTYPGLKKNEKTEEKNMF